MDFKELYDKAFLREEYLKLNSGKVIKIKEFTFNKEMSYLKDFSDNKDAIIQLLFICPEITTEDLKVLTVDEANKIFELNAKVNFREPVKSEVKENTVQLNMLECIDYLASRYGALSPDWIMENKSIRWILNWNDIARGNDLKMAGQPTDKKDIQSELQEAIKNRGNRKPINERKEPPLGQPLFINKSEPLSHPPQPWSNY